MRILRIGLVWLMVLAVSASALAGDLQTSIANVAQFPDVIVPAGVTEDKMPVTISFIGPAYSEPKLLGYAYAYEQATHHRVSPSTTPALPGEKFDY